MIIYVWIIFAVNHIAIATIRIVLNIAIGYILLQYIVQLLPTFATNLILRRLYPFAVYCTDTAVIHYTLNIGFGYILLQYIVRLLSPFATHSILPSAIFFCILPLASSFCTILYDYCHHLLHTQYCHWLYLFQYILQLLLPFATLNIAIGYILFQYIVQLLPPFATHSILSSVISFCGILYRYCHHLQCTQYCHWLYPFAVFCMAIATIRYTLSISTGYILLQHIVQLLPSFTTHTIFSSAISCSSILHRYCCQLLLLPCNQVEIS